MGRSFQLKPLYCNKENGHKFQPTSLKQVLIPFQGELFEHNNGRGENKCESWHIRGYFEAKLSNMNQSLLFNMTDLDKDE